MKKRFTPFLLAASLLFRPALASPKTPMSLDYSMVQAKRSALHAVRYHKVKKAGVWCHVVDVDLNCPQVELESVRAGDSGRTYQSFGSLVRQHRPLAAITGTFFDTANGAIICNLVRRGRLLVDGHVGNTIWIDSKGQANFRATAGTNGHKLDWSDAQFAVTCGPTLVRDGRIVLDPSPEGFHDPGLFRMAARAGLGITTDNHLLMVTVNRGISMGHFAQVMQRLGARHSINLDGGSSTGIFCRGNYASVPGRMMTNLIMVKLHPGDPIPREVFLETAGISEEVGPSNVDDFTGTLPKPEPIDLDHVDSW